MQIRNPLTATGNFTLVLLGVGILVCLFLSGCVKQPVRPPEPPQVSLPPPAEAPPVTHAPAPDPAPLVEQLEPDVQQAMERYHKTGKAPVIDRSKSHGFVRYPYALIEPVVYCQLLHVCEIELEEGEAVVGKPVCGACWTETAQGSQGTLDDTGYLWDLNGFLSDPEGRRTQHITVKPREYATTTNLFFGTDKGRVYRLKLVPKVKQRDVRVSFYYPEEAEKQFAAMRAQVLQEKAAQQQVDVGCGFVLPVDQLDQQYTIEGGSAWIANDGKTTCVRTSSMNGELPVVFTHGTNGKSALLNYRVKPGGYYQIDGVPAVLSFVSGAGETKQTMTITREGR
jgi:type IV secretory pathway VirB9-like protein